MTQMHMTGHPFLGFAKRPIKRSSSLCSLKDTSTPNRLCSEYYNLTPLHFAVTCNSESIVEMLAAQATIDLYAKDRWKNMALGRALQSGRTRSARALFLHPRIITEIQVTSLKVLRKEYQKDYQDLVTDVLECIADGYLSDQGLSELIDLSDELDTSGPYIAFVKRACQRDLWRTWPEPLHQAARVGDLDLMKMVIASGKNLAVVDEDGWPCLDYARAYRHDALDDDLIAFVGQNTLSSHSPPEYAVPDSLHVSHVVDGLEVGRCKEDHHKQCAGLNGKSYVVCGVFVLGADSKPLDVRVIQEAERLGQACIRTEHCIPSASPSNKSFYFEVTIKANSASN